MSQQYHNAPHFGTNYQAALPFPPFSTTSPHESASTPMLQQPAMQPQHHHVPPPQANDIRFNANMQVPMQGAPFPFPPSINPDLFGRFPPPPPPLPLNFNSSPSTPGPFSQFTGHAAANLAASAQSYKPQTSETPASASTGFGGYSFAPQNAYSAGARYSHTSPEDMQLRQHAKTSEPDLGYGASSYQPSKEVMTQSQESHEDESQMYDPAKAFRVSETSFLYPRSKSTTTKPLSSPSGSANQQLTATEPPQPRYTHAELKEKAKAAILSLSSHRITYNDLLAEGIAPGLLRSLFEELQLDSSVLLHKSLPSENTIGHTTYQKTETQTTTPEVPTKLTQHNSTAAAAQNLSGGNTGQASSVNTGMERKDRIAQLLAAKAAKSHSANVVSPSASPASASDPPAQPFINKGTDSQAATARSQYIPTQIPIAADNASSTSMDAQLAQIRSAASSLLQGQSDIDLPAQLSSLLPTPIRESLVENGLSSLIPGLFMPNDEDSKDSRSQAEVLTPDLPDSTKLANSSFENRSSRKRSSDWMADSEESASKRLAQPEQQNLDVIMGATGSEEGEASEGEIVEETEAVNYSKQPRQSLTVQESAIRNYRTADGGNGVTSSKDSLRSSAKKQQIPDTVRTVVSAPSPRPISKLTPAQLAERAAQLKADLLRQRRIRQQQLTDGMPALDEEVVKTQQRIEQSKLRLADVRGQLQKYEAEAIRARESERDLLVEIQRLERQLEEGMNGQKRFSDELKTIKLEAPDLTSGPERALRNQLHSSNHSALGTTKVAAETSSSEQNNAAAANHKDQNPEILESTSATAPRHSHDSSGINTPDSTRSRSDGELSNNSPSETYDADNIGGQISANQLQSELSSAVNSRNALSDADASPSDKESDLSSRSEDSRMSIDNESDEESEGSASMSDSGSEDYEPAEQEVNRSAITTREDSDEEYEPEEADATLGQSNEDVDDYEPSETFEQPDSNGSQPGQQSDATPEIPASDNNGTHHQSADVSEQPTQRISEVDQHPKVDDQEGDIQLSEANTLTRTHEMAQPIEHTNGNGPELDTDIAMKPHYVPYQSPLSSFKSYRFHSSFNDKIKSGYRSLTYSNNIDPTRPICPTELSGAVCTDPHCEEQHFESMALTDDKILVQMSSANDITDKALRDQYLIGLKQVIAGLRQNNVKDFSEVADALSRYRRQWADDHLTF